MLALLGLILPSAQGQTDSLPSWNEGASKLAILDFVNRVTQDGGPELDTSRRTRQPPGARRAWTCGERAVIALCRGFDRRSVDQREPL